MQDTADEGAAARPGLAAQLMEDLPPSDVRHVLDVFAADLVRLYDTLCRHAAAEDAESFRRTAHALAGAAGAVGAGELDAACRAAMRPGGAGLATSLEAIGAAAAAAEAELQTALRRLDAGNG